METLIGLSTYEMR